MASPHAHVAKPGRSGAMAFDPRVAQPRTMPIVPKVTEKGVVPFVLARRPLPMTYRDLIERAVFGLGPRLAPCNPCFSAFCGEYGCEHHGGGGAPP